MDAKLQRAVDLAHEVHYGQYYGSKPYVYHLQDVVRMLLWCQSSTPYQIMAAWLHDVAEDHSSRLEEVNTACGPEVRDMVWALTGVGKTREERNRAAYHKLQNCREAIPVKVADRIANVEACWDGRDKRLFMYYAEDSDFRSWLYRPNECDGLWSRYKSLWG